LYLLCRPYESSSWVFRIHRNGSTLTLHMTQCHKLCHVIVVPTTHHIFKMHISYLLHSQKQCPTITTLAPLTLIILFSEFSNFQKKWKFIKTCKEKYWIFKNILFVKMKISKINWLFDKHMLKLPRYNHINWML